MTASEQNKKASKSTKNSISSEQIPVNPQNNNILKVGPVWVPHQIISRHRRHMLRLWIRSLMDSFAYGFLRLGFPSLMDNYKPIEM